VSLSNLIHPFQDTAVGMEPKGPSQSSKKAPARCSLLYPDPFKTKKVFNVMLDLYGDSFLIERTTLL
jgi:hypothetical protein